MDTSVTNKTYPSDVIGTRNPWPLPANHQQLNSEQSSPLTTSREPSGTDAQEDKASNAPQGFKAPVSLPQGPGIGRGIGRFAGSHSALFPPGPQKGYHSKNSLTSIQNMNSRSPFYNSIPNLNPPGSSITTNSTSIEQWQTAEGGTCNGIEKNMKGKELQNYSDTDSDGGVSLAMAQAAFLQGPGIVGFPLRPVVPKSIAAPQQQQEEPKSKELGQKQQKPQKQESKSTKKPSWKPQPSLSSHIAAVLQTPGAVSFISTRRSSSATVSPSYSTQVSIIAPMEPKKDEGGVSGDKLESRPASAEVPCIPPKPLTTPKEPTLDKWTERYTDLGTTRYWRTLNTSFVYLRNILQETVVPTLITGQIGKNLLEETPQKFRQPRDGDIVGGGAPELPKENKGRRIMEKMGYKDGTPLGVSGDGELEPVKVELRVGNRGLGLSKDDLGGKERVEKANRVERANRIERELLERVAQSERVAQIQRESLQIAIQNHATQLYRSAQAYQPQVGSAQMIQTKNNLARTINMGGPTGTSQEIIQPWQFEQMGLLEPTQALRYTISTPWEIRKTCERISQILSHLDSSKVLGVADYNSTLWSCMSRAIADLQQSQLGFLEDTELMKIARREFMQVVIGKEQTGSRW